MPRGQQGVGRRVRPGFAPHTRDTRPSISSIVPFEYAATFKLTGRVGDVHEDVINIAPEGAFVAVAIGYGLEEERSRGVIVNLTAAQRNQLSIPLGEVTLGQIPPEALIHGFRVNPHFAPLAFSAALTEFNPDGIGRDRYVNAVGETPIQRLVRPRDVSFLFSILDTATGRELQDAPAHNLAALGKSNGERPFRLLAQPLAFVPRSTIRLQVIERSEDTRGTLFIVLFGYTVLGASHCPEPVVHALLRSALHPSLAPGDPSRVIPFDYVASLELEGRSGRTTQQEVVVSADGPFVATSVGYGIAIDEPNVGTRDPREQPGLVNNLGRLDLAELQLSLFSPRTLLDGIRVRPEFRRLVFTANGDLANNFPVDLVDDVFETLNRVEDVSFRYSIFDSDVGRELQNQPIHNIAGLGIANGDRPFKRLVRPLVFHPRSLIRVTIEERFGRGTLFLVFQGYRVLGAPAGARR